MILTESGVSFPAAAPKPRLENKTEKKKEPSSTRAFLKKLFSRTGKSYVVEDHPNDVSIDPPDSSTGGQSRRRQFRPPPQADLSGKPRLSSLERLKQSPFTQAH